MDLYTVSRRMYHVVRFVYFFLCFHLFWWLFQGPAYAVMAA